MARTVARNRTLQMGLASLEQKRKLERQRIALPSQPRGDVPGLPDDPTELTDSELMSLFVRLTKWAEYLGAQLALAEVDERFADAALEKTRVLSGIDMRTNAGREAAKDESYWEAYELVVERNAYRKVLGTLFANAERNSALLSRELSRRTARSDRESRSDRFGS